MSGLSLGVYGISSEFFGPCRITGTASRLGVAGRYAVHCLKLPELRVIAKTLSDETGLYSVNRIPDGLYLVIARDHTNDPVNAAVSDYITPEPMP
jgi:hypothetical protein